MNEDTGHHLAEIGIGNEQERDHRQGPAHGAAHGFQQHDDEDGSHNDVDGQRISDPEGKVAVDPRYIHCRDQPCDAEHPVDQRQSEGSERAWLILLLAEG